MAVNICKTLPLNRLRGCSFFSTCGALAAGIKWRLQNDVPEPTQNELLLNLPDYSFVDGRPTPYGSRQLQRIKKQREYTAKIIELTSEVDLAMKLHSEREAAKQAAVEERLNRKLTEKGNKVLTN